jgi:SAM-dependent methyltransferase
MIAVGRRDYPHVEFRVGNLLDLPAADGEFGAAIAFYSIIHLAAGELRRAFEEIHRVLRPRGLFLVAFHIGAEVRHLDQWWRHAVDIDFRFFQPSQIADVIERAGFQTEMRLERVSYTGGRGPLRIPADPAPTLSPGRAGAKPGEAQKDLYGRP